MRTLREWAEQLARASSIGAVGALAAAVGCPGAPAPLDDETRRGIGLTSEVLDARIARGPGALRALLLEVRAEVALRDILIGLAARLCSRTPHVLWIVLATQPQGRYVGIAVWGGGRRPPQVAALVADRDHIIDSDAETVRLLSTAHAEGDLLTHARWLEVLGREALSRRFYRTLDRLVRALADSASAGTVEQRGAVALLYASRLLFLAFLEAKGWLDDDGDFLARRFDACMAAGGSYHQRVLLPLFFGTLNTPPRARAPAARALGRIPFLNGGLFAPTLAERQIRRLRFPDDALGALFSELFTRYRFTAREESAEWSEVAVDPEMLGKAFESLMAAHDRRDTGAFYTPYSLVEHVTAAGLDRALRGGANDVTRARLTDVSVLDPACGSGAFLVHALERIADLRRLAGDARPLTAVRREVLTRSIFGVDLNPTAVWLCELRLWLSVVIGSDESDPMAVPPLPNLDRNVRVGDSLAGADFGDRAVPMVVPAGVSICRLRERYGRATGAGKEALGRSLEREERRRAIRCVDAELDALLRQRRELLGVMRGHDLFGGRRRPSADERRMLSDARQRSRRTRLERNRLLGGGALPFSFTTLFGDVAERGGFDLVVGNPPWVRLHRVNPALRAALRARFSVFRQATWTRGADVARAGRGFAAQIDLSALFVERSLRLLRPGGTMALLLPMKLWHSLAGGGVRRLLACESRIATIEDYSEGRAVFDAVVYPSLVVADRRIPGESDGGRPSLTAVRASGRGPSAVGWTMPQQALPFDTTPGSPWLLVPAQVRDAFEHLRCAGVPMSESVIGRPHLGVKCGFNEPFLVRAVPGRAGVAEIVTDSGRTGVVELALLRPLMRGEGVRAWGRARSDEHIVWTHGVDDTPLDLLPPEAARWLGHWRRALGARTDLRGGARWWSLFRVEGARHDRPRVVWADVGREPRATVVDIGDPVVPLNSCYVARCADATDALAFAALLNSRVAAAWLAAVAEPARGGYRRYLGWTLALLPVPSDWKRARALLGPVGERAMAGHAPAPAELVDTCLEAFGLRHRDVAPLLAWFSR